MRSPDKRLQCSEPRAHALVTECRVATDDHVDSRNCMAWGELGVEESEKVRNREQWMYTDFSCCLGKAHVQGHHHESLSTSLNISYSPAPHLRKLQSHCRLSVPWTCQVCSHLRAFALAALSAWNAPPSDLCPQIPFLPFRPQLNHLPQRDLLWRSPQIPPPALHCHINPCFILFHHFMSCVSILSEKAGLNSTFKKCRSWHPVPSLHGK